MARLGRGRRSGARISHNQAAPTPTPLVRKRLTQTPVANDRASTIARFFRRKRARIVLRAPLPFLGRRGTQPIVSHADVRASSRVRFFQGRGGKLVRGVSTPTPTPLVRKRVFVETTLVSRSRLAARLRRRKPLMLRAPMPVVIPSVRPTVIVSRNRRPARVRALVRDRVRFVRSIVFAPPARQPVVSKTRVSQRARYMRRHRALVLRAPVFIPLTAIPRQPLVSRRRRAVTIRAFYGRRRARIIRSAPLATPTVRVKVAIVVRSRRAPLVARGRRNTAVLRGVSTATATPLVRRRLTLETQTGNRPKVVARVRHRQAYRVVPHGGAAGFTITGPFDPSTASEASFYSTPTGGFFNGTPAEGNFDTTPAEGSFDATTPRMN